MISPIIVGTILAFLMPLPQEIYASWRWWTRSPSQEIPAPPPLTRQDGVIFEMDDMKETPSGFVSRTTIVVIDRSRVLPRTISTDLGRWNRGNQDSPLSHSQEERVVTNDRKYCSYISWMCLCCRTDSPSRRSER